jgi:hypothetical protein
MLQLPNAMTIITNAQFTVVQTTGIAAWREKVVIFPALTFLVLFVSRQKVHK